MRARVKKSSAQGESPKAETKPMPTKLSNNQLRFLKVALTGTHIDEPDLLAGRP